jgi:hypothetical protein
MNPYMLNHFQKVARNMNHYVAASSYNHHRLVHDRRNYDAEYRGPSIFNSGLHGLFASGLNAIGMPPKVVNLGYRIGYFIDNNA